MTSEVAAIRGVRNNYGERTVGGALGVIKTDGVKVELAVDITGDKLDNDDYAEVRIPAGAMLKAAYVEVTEAFTLTGTSPTILVGTEGSAVTNGCVVSEALAEAVGTTDITSTLTGTWAEGESLVAETIVGVTMGGTSPVSAATGKGRIVVEYVKIAG